MTWKNVELRYKLLLFKVLLTLVATIFPIGCIPILFWFSGTACPLPINPDELIVVYVAEDVAPEGPVPRAIRLICGFWEGSSVDIRCLRLMSFLMCFLKREINWLGNSDTETHVVLVATQLLIWSNSCANRVSAFFKLSTSFSDHFDSSASVVVCSWSVRSPSFWNACPAVRNTSATFEARFTGAGWSIAILPLFDVADDDGPRGPEELRLPRWYCWNDAPGAGDGDEAIKGPLDVEAVCPNSSVSGSSLIWCRVVNWTEGLAELDGPPVSCTTFRIGTGCVRIGLSWAFEIRTYKFSVLRSFFQIFSLIYLWRCRWYRHLVIGYWRHIVVVSWAHCVWKTANLQEKPEMTMKLEKNKYKTVENSQFLKK